MKRLLLLFILTIFSSETFAQNDLNFTIDWKNPPYLLSGAIQVQIPYFQGNHFHYDYELRKITFRHSQYEPENVTYTITKITYEPIQGQLLQHLNTDLIKSDIEFTSQNTYSRDLRYIDFSFSPIIKEGNLFKRVTSFQIVKSQNPISNQSYNTSEIPSISNSVLATGEWFRFYVEKSGVYKLSKSFIESLGLKLNGVDPRKIKIYGNGGRMLPLANATPYPFDLQENAIQVIGEDDGRFDSSDYILFYAEGMDNYNAESDTHLNLYSNRSYYYITTTGFQYGKRITPMSEPSQNPTITVNEFDDYQFYEKDINNFTRLSRKWYGEAFNINNEQTFKFSFPNLITSEPINFKVVNGLNSTNKGGTFTYSVNGTNIGQVAFPIPSSVDEDDLGRERSLTTTFNANSDDLNITVNFTNNGIPTVIGYLDYIAISAKRTLRGINKQFRFTNKYATNNVGVMEYKITFANQITQVWDITDIYNVTGKTNSAQSEFTFKTTMGSERKFIAVDSRDYYTPLREGQNTRVANQNLKGTLFKDAYGNFSDVDYIIVTPAKLKPQADKLANFHRQQSQLRTRVVTLEQIYQEFSSGKQDLSAIKNLVRYLYYNASTAENRIKYVNLFGDASFDFKDRIRNNTNIVPIFHYYNPSLSGNVTYNMTTYTCSDDYFGLMDDNEGLMIQGDKADVAVGRMLVTNNQEAEAMIQKIFDYYDEKSYGRWRNNITLIADDIDKSSDRNMQFKLNQLADAIQSNKPFFNINKIYLDAYTQETSSGGARYPQARKDIIQAFENGSLVFNYLGHGGEEGLAHERIFEKVDGENLSHRYKYPVFITVTCEFTKFDNPLHPTAGEYVYWNPKGGAVNMITTTRKIGIITAEEFNLTLGKIMFSYGEYANQPYPTVGEALRLAKNQYGVFGTRMVACVGDPALSLAIAEPQIVITHINDTPIDQFTGSLEALAHVTIKGEVQHQNGSLDQGYHGELAIQVFDKKIDRVTNANDNYTENGQPVKMEFQILGETIFRGNASVQAGKFSFGFIVPKDIRIPIDFGRVSFFSKRNNPLQAKTGYSESVKVGGINQNAPQDTTPPTVKLYMNDTNFISGGITNNAPIFIAQLQDESGMNTAGGIGHDMIAILDGDETKPYILNDYYQTQLDDYKNGVINYPFRDLTPGLHTITFKAYDVYNNMVTAEIQFVVVGNEDIQLDKVLNYPNPFVSYTEFWFNHNRPFEPLEVQVQVMTITGKVVWTRNQTIITEGFLSRDVKWDGRDDFGDRIGKGVYIYKLTVRSTLTGKTAEKFEKLVIL